MRSYNNLGDFPIGSPLVADSVAEFHAARVLMLIQFAGAKGKIEGLTKLAKLDFFVRYPEFFRRAAATETEQPVEPALSHVESTMVRHHYGPWDKRYYHVLAYLESRGLLRIEKAKTVYTFELTELGRSMAKQLAADAAFKELKEQMELVRTTFGKKTGSALKSLIYRLFDDEVASKPLGEVIR